MDPKNTEAILPAYSDKISPIEELVPIYGLSSKEASSSKEEYSVKKQPIKRRSQLSDNSPKKRSKDVSTDESPSKRVRKTSLAWKTEVENMQNVIVTQLAEIQKIEEERKKLADSNKILEKSLCEANSKVRALEAECNVLKTKIPLSEEEMSEKIRSLEEMMEEINQKDRIIDIRESLNGLDESEQTKESLLKMINGLSTKNNWIFYYEYAVKKNLNYLKTSRVAYSCELLPIEKAENAESD